MKGFANSLSNVLLSLVFIWVIFLSPQVARAAEVHLNSCGILNQANTTYILDSDVSSAGTCFEATTNNITLDLNGKTVTYNTQSVDNVYGFLSNWNPVGLRITNGNFLQGSGKGYQSYAIYMRQGKSIEVDHLNITYSGDDNMGIVDNNAGSASSVQIHDNIIRPQGGKRALSHYGGFGAILVGSNGDIDIYNNDIQGTGYSGIIFGFISALSDTLKINNNTIKMDTPVRDGYAISIASPSAAAIGFEIANNTIIQTSGRGILVNGNVTDADPGPGFGTIHNNYIEVRESRDAGEYDAPGASTGICLRFGAHDIKVYENTIKAYAGQNACPSSFPTSKGADCIARALKIHSGSGGKNLEIYNNTVEAITTDASLPASGIYAINSYLNSPVPDVNVVFHNNQITSNSIIVDLNSSDGSGNYQYFLSNNFIKGANPLGFHSIRAGFWTGISIENIFTDNNWQNGAGKDDVILSTSGGADYSLYTKWYLDVIVKDNNGNLLKDATVKADSIGGAAESISSKTDSSGKARLELTEFKRWGRTYPQTTNYDRFTPHKITVSKDGYTKYETQITMDSSKSLEATIIQLFRFTKEVDKASVFPGDILTFTLSYHNLSSGDYLDARIEDPVPVGTNFVSADNGGLLEGDKIIWQLGNLSPGVSGSVSFQVEAQ